MKFRFILISLLTAAVFFACAKDEPPVPGDSDIVYVCSSNSAKTYHTQRDCGQMKSCSADVLEVTRRKARENERIVCMTCKKREDEQKQKDSVK
ncbi:MAG: hypothetical protein IAE90_13495 [Ignavibacteria bacterium]|nr:hypothetical protein [Ignavibacteria bacterium]